MGDAHIPVGSIIAALIAFGGVIGTLFGLLMKSNKSLADERKERAEQAERQRDELAKMLEVQNEILDRVEKISKSRFGGGGTSSGGGGAPPRPQFTSNPGVRRG
ncbi:MAG TPA: hypothetical protein VFX49_11700 [Chloroflexota bacterium]|nr:hypothetical protein [Chloroflexota bacterium]